jgi:hypothetical protein
MGEDFYIAFLYENEGVALDESGFLQAIYLELKADNVGEMRQRIVASGVKVLEVPAPHLSHERGTLHRSAPTGATRRARRRGCGPTWPSR